VLILLTQLGSDLNSAPCINVEETNVVDSGNTESGLAGAIPDAEDPSAGSQVDLSGADESGVNLPGSSPPTTHAILCRSRSIGAHA
jgi:hypothetical protein